MPTCAYSCFPIDLGIFRGFQISICCCELVQIGKGKWLLQQPFLQDKSYFIAEFSQPIFVLSLFAKY
jgi:hypothetical protein